MAVTKREEPLAVGVYNRGGSGGQGSLPEDVACE